MAQYFEIDQSEYQLTVTRTKSSLLEKLLVELFKFAITLVVFAIVPINAIWNGGGIITLLYLLPLFQLIHVLMALHHQAFGQQYVFNTEKDYLLLNDNERATLSNINHLELNHRTSRGRRTDSILAIVLNDNARIRILKTGSSGAQKLISYGREIAKFLSVSFIEKDEFNNEEVLWGKSKTDDSSISHLNNDY